MGSLNGQMLSAGLLEALLRVAEHGPRASAASARIRQAGVTLGLILERQLRSLALKHPLIVEVRGAGLIRGLELSIDAAAVVDQARENGLLVNRTDERVVRMLPPLNIEAADIDRAMAILDTVLANVESGVPA